MSNASGFSDRRQRAWWIGAAALVPAMVLLLLRQRHLEGGPPVSAGRADGGVVVRPRAEWWPEARAGAVSVFPAVAVSVAAKSAHGRAVDDPGALRSMILTADVPIALRAEAVTRLCSVTAGNGFGAWVGPLLREAALPDLLHAALMHGLREQELPVTAAGMLAVAGTPQHPRADEARFWLVNVLGMAELPPDQSARRRSVERALGRTLPLF